MISRVCVFCGSSMGRDPEYAQQASALGTLLGERGIGLVYGGAKVGTMGAIADAALAAGAEVIGVIPEHMQRVELAHTGLSTLHVVADMHERKAKMAALADGFLALPGGAGTLEELFEVWTWAQLGLHSKPIGLVDIAGYYQPLGEFVEHMVGQGFLRREHQAMLSIDKDPAVLLDAFVGYAPPVASKWAGR